MSMTMNNPVIKRFLLRKPGFWLFQATGWILFTVGMRFYYIEKPIDSFINAYRFFITYIIGFLLTLGLRYFYRWIFSGDRSIFFIISTIILSSAVCMAVWEPIDILLSFPFWSAENLSDFIGSYQPFTMIHYYKLNIYWYFVILLWSLLYVGIKSRMDLAETRQRSEKASFLAQESQLQMLRYQLNPHFLFNALNSIQALVYDDPAHADRMITQLSDFLRYTLRDKDKLFIPLGEEVKIVEMYLSMEQTRFPDRLSYSIRVTPDAAGVEIIAFLLQPFVENAVKYGMKTSPEGLDIVVNGYCRNGSLILEVINNGEWVEQKTEGTGIRNAFDKLQNAYPGKYNLHIDKSEDQVHVTIEIRLGK